MFSGIDENRHDNKSTLRHRHLGVSKSLMAKVKYTTSQSHDTSVKLIRIADALFFSVRTATVRQNRALIGERCNAQ